MPPRPPPASLQQITGLDPEQRRPPPRRYPLVGFGFLALFVALTGVLAARDPTRLPVVGNLARPAAGAHGEDPRVVSLAPERKLELVRLGRAARTLTCLVTYSWNDPKPECVRAVIDHGEQIEELLPEALLQVPGKTYPEVAEAVALGQALARPARDLARMLRVLEQNRHPMSQQMAMNVAQLASDLSARVDELLSLDDPKWDPLLAPPAAPRDAEAPHADAVPPPPTEPVAQQPVPPAANLAPLPMPSDTRPSDTVLPTQPKSASADVPAPAGPSLMVRGLVAPLADVRALLQGCGHDPNQIADAAWRSRTRLESLAPLLSAYRESKRSGDDDLRAQAFARQLDQARSRLLRAAAELSAAAKTSLARTPDGFDDDPFAKADRLLQQALADVAAAEGLAPNAPP